MVLQKAKKNVHHESDTGPTVTGLTVTKLRYPNLAVTVIII